MVETNYMKDRILIWAVAVPYILTITLPQVLLWRRDCAWSRGTESK